MWGPPSAGGSLPRLDPPYRNDSLSQWSLLKSASCGRYTEVMGDSGEGLVDNEGRIQERMEELQRNRERKLKRPIANPELARRLESLQLAHKELVRSLERTTHEARRKQLAAAIADLERQTAEVQAALEKAAE